MLRLFRASNDAPLSPTLVCNYAGRVVVAQPGAKPEGANRAAIAGGLRRAPCQKSVLDLMTRAFSDFLQRSAHGRELSVVVFLGRAANLFPS